MQANKFFQNKNPGLRPGFELLLDWMPGECSCDDDVVVRVCNAVRPWRYDAENQRIAIFDQAKQNSMAKDVCDLR